MFGAAVMLIMLVLRVVIPLGLLLWLGERVRRHQPTDFHQMTGQA